MKKCISLLAVFLISGAVALYGKKIYYIISEKPESKTVEFSIYAGSDYSSKLYKKSKARVILTVCKFSGNNQEIVWQEEVDKGSMKNYPSSENALFKKVSVHNVFESKETLAAYYEVIYESKGSKLSYQKGLLLSRGSNENSLDISL